jgi:hypothetical protein
MTARGDAACNYYACADASDEEKCRQDNDFSSHLQASFSPAGKVTPPPRAQKSNASDEPKKIAAKVGGRSGFISSGRGTGGKSTLPKEVRWVNLRVERSSRWQRRQRSEGV